MRSKTRFFTISLALLLSSCTPKTEATLQAFSSQYKDVTGVTPVQSVGLLAKWWSDYENARVVTDAATK